MPLTAEMRYRSSRIIYFLLLLLVFWVLMRVTRALATRIIQWRAYTSDKHKASLCEHTMTLTDDALIEVTPYSENRVFWRGTYQVVETTDYIYIFLSAHSAHIIPKRAFADAEEARRFYEKAASLHAAAQAPTG